MTTETETQGLSEALFARGALMGLHIGRWTAVKKMSSGDLLLEDVDENALYLGHKKLLPKMSTHPLVVIEGKARTALATKSMEFPIAGARFVTYAALPGIVERLAELKVEWDTAVEVLLNTYPALREEQLKALDRQAQLFVTQSLRQVVESQYEETKKKLDLYLLEQKAENITYYPKVDDLRRKYSFGWRMFTISALEGINELDVKEVQEAQDRLRADLQDWVRTATSSMHKTLGEAAANAKSMLEKNGKLTPRNLTPLFNAFESFLSVDFTGKSTFQDTIQEIKSKFLVANPDGSYNLAAMVEGLGNDHRRAEFDGLLATMSTLATDEIAEKAGIRSLHATTFGRMVELDD